MIQELLAALPPSARQEAEPKIRASRIKDITEYGRVVHAEMDALLGCSRSNISCTRATLYCTTFPCHNCAKHIIAAGIDQVIYVEPYPKSKAFKFHDDAISSDKVEPPDRKVRFKPFIGIGPRVFFDLFSMSMSAGRPTVRKNSKGYTSIWEPGNANPRVQVLPFAYRRFELAAIEYLKQLLSKRDEDHGN